MASASYRALEDIAARQREYSEGLARPARIRFFARVMGTGETRLAGRSGIHFGAYMLEEPTFTWGVASDGSRDIFQGGLPIATAIVLKYQTTGDRKFFTGADIGFVVEAGDPTIVCNFSLIFEGVTLRTTAPMTNSIR